MLLRSALDSTLTPDDAPAVVDLVRRYPFFTVPAAALLRSAGPALDPDVRAELTARVALASSDTSKIYMLLDPASADHADFYPDTEPRRPSTDSAIDTFLETYGSTSPEEEALLNRLIFNPVPDYAQVLAAEEEASVPDISRSTGNDNDDRLNAFIVKQKQAAGQAPGAPASDDLTRRIADRHTADIPEPPADAPDNSLLSESLAKIFIRQKNYSRAYEIIEQLSLNYPKKSVYFADQLRFLRKLILIDNTKN